jgi:RNA polymerase sigma-70 factor (ECF subfamily)
MTPEQEYEYIQQARSDPRAFVYLYDHYFPRIHGYVRYRVHSQQDAEDLVADVFFKAIRGLERFRWRKGSSFAAWLFRIAHNLIVDYHRQHEGVALSLDADDDVPELASPVPLPEQVLARRETFREMRDLIATLSPRRQEVITLRFFGGLHNNEISAILGLDERTVAAHLCRGVQDLQRRYTAERHAEAVMEAEV